jgi:hypothetical protein
MMSMSKEERIRTEAYKRWEMEGRPEGAHERHWLEALETIGDDAEDLASGEAPLAAETPLETPAPVAKARRSKKAAS